MAEDIPSPTSQTAPPAVPAALASPSVASSSSSTPTTNKGPANNTTDTGTATGISHPPGHGLRRARTTFNTADLQSPLRRRTTSQLHSLHSDHPSHEDSPAAAPRPKRRSSNFSEYSLSEARDLLNPNVEEHNGGSHTETSSLAALSLAFALLPALAGILFKNGSAVVTDIMLLGLAGVFLHWSVTQPWAWYHSAQEVRVQNEELSEAVFEEDSEYDETSDADAPPPLDDVPEDAEVQDKQPQQSTPKHTLSASEKTAHQDAALRELYRYEILALFSCFILPLIGAYLLHAIRSQLSRPSEGLVSNYNLTIFLLVSEMRVLSHLIKLLKSRTLHLQRVVQGNAASSTLAPKSRLQDVLDRLDRLESSPSQSEEGSASQQQQQSNAMDSGRTKREASLVRDVRNAIQPDLDALNRAVRRYEKKATVLQLQTESRFTFIDSRLEDAIALAAAAAKNSNSNPGLVAWTMSSVVSAVLFPLNALLAVFLLPLKTMLGLTNGKRRAQGTSGRSGRTGRTGAAVQGQGKWSSDRVPGRVGKR